MTLLDSTVYTHAKHSNRFPLYLRIDTFQVNGTYTVTLHTSGWKQTGEEVARLENIVAADTYDAGKAFRQWFKKRHGLLLTLH